MKYILFIAVLTLSCTLRAQFTITEPRPGELRVDSIRIAGDSAGTAVVADYFSEGLYKAQRRAIRKERNTIEFNANARLTQTQFDNWATGGQNTFSGRSTILFRHQYKRERFNFDYRFDARYGISVIDNQSFKNEDEFKFNFMVSRSIRSNWSYAGSIALRSQFSNGYKSRTDNTLKSAFMAPGVMDISVGFNWRRQGSPFNITLSPIGGNMIYVLNDELSQQGLNGVTKGEKSLGSLGPSFRVEFDKEFAGKVLRYRSSLFAFSNIERNNNARWDNTFEIRTSKYLTTEFYWLMCFDELAKPPTGRPIQLTYAITIGLTYSFKNK